MACQPISNATGVSLFRLAATAILTLTMACSAMAQEAPANPAAPATAPATRPTVKVSPEQAYREFNQFCLDNFSAAKEPLAAEYAAQYSGKALKIVADSEWKYTSENSASIAWETSLPCRTHIEYGPTNQYGATTPEPERPFYLHLHQLKNLKINTLYHYRQISVDESGNRLESADATFTTTEIKGAIHIPGTLGKPPYDLNQPNTTYLLTEDIIAPTTALSMNAPNITLDLNGHTITYFQDATATPGPESKGFGILIESGFQGVRCSYATRTTGKLFNGAIIQGAGPGGWGSLPVVFRGTEIAGIAMDYHGTQESGVSNECQEIHHCTILDRGTELTNRHQGTDGIAINGSAHHNLLKRVRQRGIAGAAGSRIEHNEIYVDSCATNSFGIFYYKTKNAQATDNHVFGKGYLAIGIGTVSEGVANIKVQRNFIQMQATAPDTRWAEYGDQSGAYCVRVTWGGEKLDYSDNIMISRGRDGGMVRGIWFCPGEKITDVAFRHNTIKVLVENDKSDNWGAIVISGEDKPGVQPGLFEANTIISNFCHVRLGEEYGTGNNARFINNTFIRTGDLERYSLIRCGFWNQNHQGSVFIDSKFEGQTGFDHIAWIGDGKRDFSVGQTLTIKTAPGTTVRLTDKTGKELFAAIAGADGLAKGELINYTAHPEATEQLGPFTITAEKEGKTREKKLTPSETSGVVEMPL